MGGVGVKAQRRGLTRGECVVVGWSWLRVCSVRNGARGQLHAEAPAATLAVVVEGFTLSQRMQGRSHRE